MSKHDRRISTYTSYVKRSSSKQSLQSPISKNAGSPINANQNDTIEEQTYLETSSESLRNQDSVSTFSDSADDEFNDNLKGFEAIRSTYLSNKKSHSLKCAMIDAAARRSKT